MEHSYHRITARIIILLTVGLGLSSPARAQDFTEIIDTSLAGIGASSVAWGDYDNDGDLDFLLTGSVGCKVYQNNEGSFTDISAGLVDASGGSVAWGDYDNDGDLDILLTGYWLQYRHTRVYQNNGGSFTVAATLTGVSAGSAAWGDYDNDGDLDILLTGHKGGSYAPYGISRIYRNDGGSFTDISANLTAVYTSSVAWGDYDNDGDLDFLLTGLDGSSPNPMRQSIIYKNNGDGNFGGLGMYLPGTTYNAIYSGSVAWGDYDNDGDLDILLSGNNGWDEGLISQVYRNNGGSFTDMSAGLDSMENSSVAWGDYDNDGDLDILVTGYAGTTYFSKVYQNNAGSFTDISAGLTGLAGAAAWGDYDNDGDLDILLSGYDGANLVTKIYRNNSVVANSAPPAPTALLSSVNQDTIALSWTMPVDSDETSNIGLSYNLRIGTTPLGHEIMSAQGDSITGFRRIPALGNAQENLSWILHGLPNGTFSWSVQSIDAAFAGSAFAPEQTFVIAVPPAAPQNLVVTDSADGAATLQWDQNTEGDILRYRIYGDTLPTPTILYDSTNAVENTTKTITGLTVGLTYYFRVTAVDAGLRESDFSNEVNMIPLAYGPVTDSLALVALYDSTDGVNWTDKTNWFSGPINNWYGVTAMAERVIQLNLASNNLSGAIPAQIGNLSNLTDLYLYSNQLTAVPAQIDSLNNLMYLYLYDNQLVDLPDLSSLTSLYVLRIQNNKLTFEDIEPIIGIPYFFTYSPQDSVGAETDTTVEADSSLILFVSVGGTANQYKWIKDGRYISGATDDTLTLDPVDLSDTGDYVCSINNTIATSLYLFSRPKHVTVIDTTAPAAPQNLVEEAGDGQVTLTWNQNTESDFLRYRVYSGTAVNPTTLVDSTSSITDTTKILANLTNGTPYYFRITAVDVTLNESGYSNEVSATPTSLSVSDQDRLPTEFALHPAYPNPFNPSTTVKFDVPQLTDMTVVVYDLLGREVVTLVEGAVQPGYHRVVWYGNAADGSEVPTGMYIARLVTPEYAKSIKMVLLK